MERWENNIIADKLNSLQDLPDGYAPNIASKWELIQAGLDGKKKRSKRGWFAGVSILALLIVCGTIYFSKPAEPIRQTPIVENSRMPLPSRQVVPVIERNEQTTTTAERINPITKKHYQKPKKLTLPREQAPVIQPTSLPIDTIIKIRVDTSKVLIPIADLKTKPKKKVFQKDFEGFTTTSDSSHHKTAKGFQIQWRSSRDKEATIDQPRIRLTQNF